MNSAHEWVPDTAVPSRVRNNGNLCFLPVTLLNPKTSTHIKIRALLDSRCSRDLINPILVVGMGLVTKPLKETLTFEQIVGEKCM